MAPNELDSTLEIIKKAKEAKVCPILSMSVRVAGYTDCLKDRCQIWDGSINDCDFKVRRK